MNLICFRLKKENYLGLRPHWGGGGGLGIAGPFHFSLKCVQSRIPKLRFEYPHISFSNILYPYSVFLRLSRIPVTPNKASGLALTFILGLVGVI